MKQKLDNTIEEYKKENISFEQAIQELEEIVNKLETSEITLEKSCKIYEKGISLRKYCEYLLNEAEGKWTYLKEENNQFTETEIMKETNQDL